MMEPNRTIRIVRADQEDHLSEKQLVDYYDQRKALLTWLLRMGKNPEKAEGYSPYTVKGTGDRTARFDKWVWKNRGGYKLPPT